MNWLQHPEIYKLSAVLVLINLAALYMCFASGNFVGMFINSLFLVINGASAIGNFLIRNKRRQHLRQTLIQTTIGSD